MKKIKNKITVIFPDHTMLRLTELANSLNVSYSLLIRTMVTDFFAKYDNRLYDIIDNQNNSKAKKL